VELFEEICKTHDREGLDIRTLADRFRVPRRAVRQALASPIPPPRKSAVHPSPALDPWKTTIDRWLAEDESAPRERRHTAQRVFQLPVEQLRAKVGESTVRRYVAQARRKRPVALAEVKVPQIHPLGKEAEVDFGQVSFVCNGKLVTGHLFVMRLSASGRAFHRVDAGETQEVFLDGHVGAFERFGGVPRRIRYDNLKPAVIKVLRGRDRLEAACFVALRSYYGFDSFFCIPGRVRPHMARGASTRPGPLIRSGPKIGVQPDLRAALLLGGGAGAHP